MPNPINLKRFAALIAGRLPLIESETRYRDDDGVSRTAVLELVAAWDDGNTYQIVILVDAGPLKKFVGYSNSVGYARRQDVVRSTDFDSIEDYLATWIFLDGMFGDGIVSKLEACPDEIVWRYPQAAKYTPRNIEELYALSEMEDVWFNSDLEYL